MPDLFAAELAALDATAQADLVRRGDLRPVNLVEAAIQRIEALNPRLNAVITSLYDKALAAARDPALLDRPFRGVPLLLKDYLCETVGDPYYEGMHFLRDRNWHSTADTHLATRFRAAGFIFLGKTNLPELAGGPITEPEAFGPTLNPWDLTRTPGGSSGGSAAAVAAGMVPVAHGNDGTGSLRIPAACCGLVGLKPSRGRVSPGPGRGDGLLGNVVEGVLTRTVRDSAAILDAIAGPMAGDLAMAPSSLRPFRQEIGLDPGHLRVGLLIHDPFLDLAVHPACAAAVEQTGRLLQDRGHAVELAYPAQLSGVTGLGPAFLGVVGASRIATALDYWSARTGQVIGPGDVEAETWVTAEKGRTYTAVQVHAAYARIMQGATGTARWWAEGFDLLVTPTQTQPPIALGIRDPDRLLAGFGLFTMMFSFTGQPAISLPLGWTADGLPIGVQIVAAYGREDRLIRVAAQLEEDQPWAERRPPVWPDGG